MERAQSVMKFGIHALFPQNATNGCGIRVWFRIVPVPVPIVFFITVVLVLVVVVVVIRIVVHQS